MSSSDLAQLLAAKRVADRLMPCRDCDADARVIPEGYEIPTAAFGPGTLGGPELALVVSTELRDHGSARLGNAGVLRDDTFDVVIRSFNRDTERVVVALHG
jgi:hypothetical protein